ncbi:MAG: hypothetical protein V2B20_12750 [Pseudomonadota bacterium]
MSGSESITTLLAAKIYFFPPPFKQDSLTAWYEFFANRILYKSIVELHIRWLMTVPFLRRSGGFSPTKDQPVGDIEKNDKDDYP